MSLSLRFHGYSLLQFIPVFGVCTLWMWVMLPARLHMKDNLQNLGNTSHRQRSRININIILQFKKSYFPNCTSNSRTWILLPWISPTCHLPDIAFCETSLLNTPPFLHLPVTEIGCSKIKIYLLTLKNVTYMFVFILLMSVVVQVLHLANCTSQIPSGWLELPPSFLFSHSLLETTKVALCSPTVSKRT
jgi:hypothetical protein